MEGLEFVPMEHVSYDVTGGGGQWNPHQKKKEEPSEEEEFDGKLDEFTRSFLQKSGFNPDHKEKGSEGEAGGEADDPRGDKPADAGREGAQDAEQKNEDELKALLGKLNQNVENLGKVSAQPQHSGPQQREPEPQDDDLGLKPEDIKKIEVIREMEANDPEKYKGLSEGATNFYRKLKDYRSKWEAENQGGEFNLTDPEHSEFVELNHPEIDEKDFWKAEVRLENKNEINKKDLEYKRKDFESQVEVHRNEFLGKELPDLVSGVDSEIGEFIKQNPGENLNALKEADPIAFQEIEKSAYEAMKLSETYYRVLNTPGGYEVDLQGNPDHAKLAELLVEKENKIKNSPDSEKIWDGKQFATLKEYRSMSPEQRSQHWYIDSNVMNSILKSEFSAEAKRNIEKNREEFYKMVPEEMRDKAKTLFQKKLPWKRGKKTQQNKSPSFVGDSQMSPISKQSNDEAPEWAKTLNKIRRGG